MRPTSPRALAPRALAPDVLELLELESESEPEVENAVLGVFPI